MHLIAMVTNPALPKDSHFISSNIRTGENGSPALAILSFHPSNLVRSEKLRESKTCLRDFLIAADPEGFLNHQQIMLALQELIKNTLDHSTGESELRLEYAWRHTHSKYFRLLYMDFWPGLAATIQAWSKDAIEWALAGQSSKIGNGINFGIGNITIVACLKQLGMQLQVRDRWDVQPFEMRLPDSETFPSERISAPLAFYAESSI